MEIVSADFPAFRWSSTLPYGRCEMLDSCPWTPEQKRSLEFIFITLWHGLMFLMLLGALILPMEIIVQ